MLNPDGFCCSSFLCLFSLVLGEVIWRLKWIGVSRIVSVSFSATFSLSLCRSGSIYNILAYDFLSILFHSPIVGLQSSMTMTFRIDHFGVRINSSLLDYL